MSDSDNSAFSGFGKFVPGFDFLQNLAAQAAGGAADKTPQLASLGGWMAPTLNVEDLDKRISELKSVQFWLDQNATALKATIQALEVQKMTLATLKGMNFNMADMANAFKLKVADSLADGVQGKDMADKATTFAGLEVPPTSFGKKAPVKIKAEAKPQAEAPAAGVVDPMQWWGALTQQFQAIAAEAMKDADQKTARNTTQSMAAGKAKDAMKTATSMAKDMATNAGKTMAGAGRAAINTALRSAQAWPTPVAANKPVTQKPIAKRPAAKKAAAKKPATKTARPTTR
jgi:hypothetical protein